MYLLSFCLALRFIRDLKYYGEQLNPAKIFIFYGQCKSLTTKNLIDRILSCALGCRVSGFQFTFVLGGGMQKDMYEIC